MSTVIEIKENESAFDNREFRVIHDSFHSKKTGKFNGICQMFVRLSDFGCEGNCLFMDYQDDIFDRTGDYIPITLEKDELKQFINFLQESYDKIP